MTCIVAIEDKGSVWMGGDSIAIDSGEDKCLLAGSKVFARGDLLFGCVGQFRALQVLRYGVKIPRRSSGKDDEEWICTSLMDAVRSAFRAGGVMTSKDGAEAGESFMLGYRGKVYEVEAGFAVLRNTRGFSAIGCGGKYAVGALTAACSTPIASWRNLGARDKVKMALETAEACNAGVARPFTILRGAERVA